MRNIVLFALAAVAVTSGVAFGGDHVPADFSSMKGIREITTRSRDKNHVVFVNVGHAIPEREWALSAAYAAGRLQINIWTNAIASLDMEMLLNKPDAVQQICGPKSRVAVFVVNDEAGPAFLAAQGKWSRVNVRSLRKDNPDAQTLRDRYAKFLLKGLAQAGGAGVSLQRDCALFYDSFTLKGMDKTGITICPMSYFPMVETLQIVGGADILDAEEPPDIDAPAEPGVK